MIMIMGSVSFDDRLLLAPQNGTGKLPQLDSYQFTNTRKTGRKSVIKKTQSTVWQKWSELRSVSCSRLADGAFSLVDRSVNLFGRK